MAIRTELSLKIPNAPGAFARIASILSVEAVNVLALALDTGGMLRLVVDNPIHAAGALRDQRHQVEERDVLYIQLPNAPGTLARVTAMIRDAGINVEYAYAATVEGDPMATMVVGVDDAQRASAATGL